MIGIDVATIEHGLACCGSARERVEHMWRNGVFWLLRQRSGKIR